MLSRLYTWTLSLAQHRHAGPALGVIACIESSVFPIPPDILLLPMVFAERVNAWRYAAICTLGSVLGAFLGYAIGFYFFALIGEPVIAFYGAEAAFAKFQETYALWGAWVVVAAAITFLPFKVATIASGVAGLPLVAFTLASLFGRSIRFFLVAALAFYFGPTIRHHLERHLTLITLGLFFLLVLGFVLIGMF